MSRPSRANGTLRMVDAALSTLRAARLGALQIDSGGDGLQLDYAASPSMVEQPGVYLLANGNLLVVYRYASTGNDTGLGVIAGLVVTQAGVIVTPRFTMTDESGISNDVRAARVNRLADGRLLLTYTAEAAGGNPNGMTTGPDGIVGNLRYRLLAAGADPTVASNWSAAATVQSGFNVTNGFDSTGYSNVIEPQTGKLVWPIAGSSTVKTWDNSETIGYLVGTYTAGGAITWSTYNTIPSTAGHSTGEVSIAIMGNGTAIAAWRDSASAATYYATMAAAVSSGLLTGTGTWTAAATLPTVGTSGVYAQPNITVLSDGTLVFPSRATPSGYSCLAWSRDNGVTWQYELLARDVASGNVWNYHVYGQAIEVSPGRVAVVFGQSGTGTQIVLRYASYGPDANPIGGLVANTLKATAAVIGRTYFLPKAGTGELPWAERSNPGQSMWEQIFVERRIPRHYSDRRTDIAAIYQNFSRTEISDDIACLTSGVPYLVRFDPEASVQFRYISLELGATAAATTHFWVGVTLDTRAVQWTSVDITASPSASTAVKFDLGSTHGFSDYKMKYLEIVAVGTTMPSLLGKRIPAAASAAMVRAPIICGPSATSGLTTPVTTTPAAPTSGGTLIPHITFSTN